jgi:hypothetical protein
MKKALLIFLAVILMGGIAACSQPATAEINVFSVGFSPL